MRTCISARYRRWKDAKPGRKAIGYMPIYVPREIVHAAGMLPVGIFGGGDQLEVIQGDAYYQSYICRIPRSTLELGLTGRLDCLDGMLFPSICDVIRNLSGMWQILFKDKYVRYLDVPQNYDDAIGGAFYMREMTGAARRPGHARRQARSPTTRCAPRSPCTTRTGARCTSCTRTARKSPGRRRPRRSTWCCARAACCRRRSTPQLVRDYLAAADKQQRPRRDNARIVLTGAFCEQPPLGLIKSIEMAGCYIVDDDFMLVMRWLLDDVPVTGDPLDELSKAFLHRSASTASKYDEKKEDKGKFLLRQVKLNGAEGVIFAAPSFCDPALLERPMLQDDAREPQDPLHRVQVRREHRPDGADPRAGRHLCRFDQTLERSMSRVRTLPAHLSR